MRNESLFIFRLCFRYVCISLVIGNLLLIIMGLAFTKWAHSRYTIGTEKGNDYNVIIDIRNDFYIINDGQSMYKDGQFVYVVNGDEFIKLDYIENQIYLYNVNKYRYNELKKIYSQNVILLNSLSDRDWSIYNHLRTEKVIYPEDWVGDRIWDDFTLSLP